MTFSRISHLALVAFLLSACASNTEEDLPPEDTNDGLITALMLEFTPVNGGDPLSFGWTAAEGDGEALVDTIPLPDRTNHNHHDKQSYMLNIELWNTLDDSEINISQDIKDAGDAYQLFFTGSAVDGPATADNSSAIIRHAYDDVDTNGLPIGLKNKVDTMAWGTGQLTVTLRHMPPEDDGMFKVDNLAEDIAENGFDAIGGENLLQVTFDIEVD